jgi:protein gp37
MSDLFHERMLQLAPELDWAENVWIGVRVEIVGSYPSTVRENRLYIG